MKNIEAADVLREYIRTNSPCNGLETALQKAITALGLLTALEKAITALEHAPDTTHNDPEPIGQQCESCGQTSYVRVHRLTCHFCGSSDLRPIYEVQKA